MAELLVIKNPEATGRADCVSGEVCVVKPDGWPWSKLERAEFAIVARPDLTVEEAESLYIQDGVPDVVRAAANAERQRAIDDRKAALAAAEATIIAAKDATAAAAAKAFDAGTLLVDPLTQEEKAVLDPATQKAVTIDRIVDKAEKAAVDAALADVLPPDPTKEIPHGVYPTRLRYIDLAAIDALGDKVTPLDVDLATVTKDVAVAVAEVGIGGIGVKVP